MTNGDRSRENNPVEAIVEPIEIAEYDPSWPRWYERERDRLLQILGASAISIEHIGSTAVPGLAAKPVLDILITAVPFPLPQRTITGIESLGYQHRGENGIAGRQYFRTRPHARHLHVFAPGAAEADRHVLFRDYLRAHSDALQRYADLKRRLAERHRFDREAYVQGKDALVSALLDAARVWRAESR